jgi:hypothetical protein
MSAFPWLPDTHRPHARGHGAARRLEAARRELTARAGVYYRLGFTATAAAARLSASIAWEFDPASPPGRGAHLRPAELSDDAIAALVRDAYARRPA